jgi:hypothetical protein
MDYNLTDTIIWDSELPFEEQSAECQQFIIEKSIGFPDNDIKEEMEGYNSRSLKRIFNITDALALEVSFNYLHPINHPSAGLCDIIYNIIEL